MNIFYLDSDPVIAAQMQCDKHVVKMIVESAQMLSTAHRLLDGTLIEGKRMVAGSIPVRWRKYKSWIHPDSVKEQTLYKAVHMNHPSTLWTMESLANYSWHYQHFVALCDEYKYRYNKIHATAALLTFLLDEIPDNIPDIGPTPVRLAMKSNPECMHPQDPVRSYREFYQTKQGRFKMVWTNRNRPEWFIIQ